MIDFRGSLELSSKGSPDFGSTSKTKSSEHEDFSSSVKSRKWYEMAIQNAQEQVEREVFNTRSYRECRDSFSVSGSSQVRGCEIEDNITSEY